MVPPRRITPCARVAAMAEEPGKGEPSLEPPRLWRKKKSADDVADRAAASATTPAPTPVAPPEPQPQPVSTPAARVETPWIPPAAPKQTSRPATHAAPRSHAAGAAKPARPARPARAPKPPRAPRAPRQRIELPPLNPRLAAAVTGLIVGGWLVLSTFSTLRMCESVRGASACGGPGLLLLVVIVAGGIALGATLLRYFKVRSAGSMSFLAVALVAVLVMVFLAGSLDQWWAIPVVAVLTVIAYSLSHWVTTTYIDPED